MNIVISFGYAASVDNFNKTEIVSDYFDHIRKQSQQKDGSIQVPDALNLWKGTNGKAESVNTVC